MWQDAKYTFDQVSMTFDQTLNGLAETPFPRIGFSDDVLENVRCLFLSTARVLETEHQTGHQEGESKRRPRKVEGLDKLIVVLITDAWYHLVGDEYYRDRTYGICEESPVTIKKKSAGLAAPVLPEKDNATNRRKSRDSSQEGQSPLFLVSRTNNVHCSVHAAEGYQQIGDVGNDNPRCCVVFRFRLVVYFHATIANHQEPC